MALTFSVPAHLKLAIKHCIFDLINKVGYYDCDYQAKY